MANIEIFRNDKFGEVRTVEIDGGIWFVGKDVATALGYSDVNKAVAMHVDEDDKKLNDKTSPSFGQRGATLINESGLYSLILSSKLESAREFKCWVTSEVLPSIRKTGFYSISSRTQQEIDNETERNRLAKANIYLELAKKYSGNKEYTQILDAYATKAIENKFVLPLPELEEKNYSATEVGEMLGVSRNVVGKIAKKLDLKRNGAFGKWYVDKPLYSAKEVNSFRYTGKAVDLIRKEVSARTAGLH